jgi:hypothetical protein
LTCTEGVISPHLVQEEGAAAGSHQETILVAHGAGERALHVPEQLRLQERLGKSAAVDGNEGAARTVGAVVDEAGNDLLAGPRLARDEHGGLRGGHGAGGLQHLPEGAAPAHRVAAVPTATPLKLGLERGVLPLQLAALHRPPADGHKLLVRKGLLDVVESPLVHGVHGAPQVGLRGHQDHGQVRIAVARRLQDGQPVHPRHADVGEHQVHRFLPHLLQPLPSAGCGHDMEALALEEDPERVEDRGLVVDDQDARLFAHVVAGDWVRRGMKSSNVAPG